METPEHRPGWQHHSIVVNDSTAARAPSGSTGLLLGSAVFDPDSTRAHLFYTSACDSPTSCAIAPRRALYTRGLVLYQYNSCHGHNYGHLLLVTGESGLISSYS
jgi:hypothetical protein